MEREAPSRYITMIKSMTGFGRGVVSTPTKKITVEIKSLNSKQFDLTLRVPPLFREAEPRLRQFLASELLRGKVEMSVTIESITAESSYSLSLNTLRAYKEQIEAMGRELNLPAPADWYNTLLRLPDAVHQEQSEMTEIEMNALMDAAKCAVGGLNEFRLQEGVRLDKFFREKVENIGADLNKTEKYEAERVPKIRKRLEEQLEKIPGIEYDAGRLEQELIFYIEKLDVNEEKLRLRSHLNYFIETLESDSSQGLGKKLGFIAQEMGREINTLGSKSNDADMQRLVVMMKDELEQIKEQVLNAL